MEGPVVGGFPDDEQQIIFDWNGDWRNPELSVDAVAVSGARQTARAEKASSSLFVGADVFFNFFPIRIIRPLF